MVLSPALAPVACPLPGEVLAAARPLGACAVRVRRSSRSRSGWVAVPAVPSSAWRSLAPFCAGFARRLGLPVFVRRSAGWILPSVPVEVTRRPRLARRSARRSPVPPWACSWARVPEPVAVPPAPAAPRLARGRVPGWRWSRRAWLRRRGFRLARRPGLVRPAARARRLERAPGPVGGPVRLPAALVEVPAPAVPPLVRLAVEEAPVIVARCPGCGSPVRSRRLAGSASDEWSVCTVCGLSRLLPPKAWRLARAEDLEAPAPPAIQLELF